MGDLPNAVRAAELNVIAAARDLQHSLDNDRETFKARTALGDRLAQLDRANDEWLASLRPGAEP
jgi:hypothetical protein